jgi:hypothetical protein
MLAWQYVVRSIFGSRMNASFYFQETSSDALMQTIEIRTLVSDPIRSLWYMHVNPPLFDIIRLLLIVPDHLLGNDITDMLVDRRLYLFYSVLFACMNVLIYRTLRLLQCSQTWSILVVVAWTLYPGNISMATYLDPTYLSAFLLMFAMLHGMKWLGGHGSINAYWTLSALLLLSWTRSLFQVQLLFPLILFSAYRFIRKRDFSPSSVARLSLVLLLAFLPLKQFVLFGTFSTSSFVGAHQLGLIQHEPTDEELNSVDVPDRLITNASKVESKYNSVANAVDNFRQESVFRDRLLQAPLVSLSNVPNTMLKVGRNALSATQEYQPNQASGNLPWASLSRWIFSGWRYLTLVVIALVGLFVRVRFSDSRLNVFILGTSVVGLQILLGALRSRNGAFEWIEANRLKFIIEPMIFCICGTGFVALGRLREHAMHRLLRGARGGN